ncbi:M15 family metallopeptidase [Deinococcus arenicola]|uniref:M15 family metallopeptidase n=1 Tax=Deinococcus arenicola TaxID=2994950 RepID=A0ABU4DUC6_9DEIO|nr:M15 family metallopeptidase [Deinococcus sp. ZS9-10]MDV6376020.1 M15 family metallopeptidase [Deinococcus sp. ZS9-10]
MSSTSQDRDRNHLHQLFRTPFEQWLAAAEAWGRPRGVVILPYETFRTAERQAYLYAQGRTRPGAVITYTLDSAHEYGCAADWVPLVDGVQNWSVDLYNQIYAAVPPGDFGLETLSFERPHVQLKGVNGPQFNISASVWAAANGIRPNVVVGSVWPLPTAPIADQRRRVFLRGLNKKNVLMVAPAATYGGQVLERLPDGRMKVGALLLTIHEDGALSFDRAE